ncbi:MAG: hypothetical protein Q4B94_00705 [Pseudomonadota bacterium]|nr:hypothetical protein [Pseudomonadota bacterium]
MLLPCAAAVAHPGSGDGNSLEAPQARAADAQDSSPQGRETTPAGRKSGMAENRSSRAPQRWHGFLPGMFR